MIGDKPTRSGRRYAGTPERFGSRVREYREHRGWTKADLARRVGISRSHLSAIESGKSVPTITIAAEIARALDQSVTTLLGQTDQAQREWFRGFQTGVEATREKIDKVLGEVGQDEPE